MIKNSASKRVERALEYPSILLTVAVPTLGVNTKELSACELFILANKKMDTMMVVDINFNVFPYGVEVNCTVRCCIPVKLPPPKLAETTPV